MILTQIKVLEKEEKENRKRTLSHEKRKIFVISMRQLLKESLGTLVRGVHVTKCTNFRLGGVIMLTVTLQMWKAE